jgi:hypothetical protein
VVAEATPYKALGTGHSGTQGASAPIDAPLSSIVFSKTLANKSPVGPAIPAD